MPTKRCCCNNGSCLIGTDDFNRTDVNPPSGDWEVVDGEWEIVDDILSCISEGPIVTTLRQPAPVVSGAKYATNTGVRLANVPENGTKEWGIICGFQDDSNFDWIHLIWRGADHSTDPNTLEPIFYRRSGGSDSVIMDHTTNPQNTFGIEPYFSGIGTVDSIYVGYCYSSLEWSIGISDPALESKWVTCGGGLDSMPSSPYGTTGFLFGDFDDWTHSQHFESRPDCFACACVCANDNSDRICWPDEMLLTLIPGPGLDEDEFTPCETVFPTIEVILHRCSSPVANASPAMPDFPLDSDKYIWYSDRFDVQGGEVWAIATCGQWDGRTVLFLTINNYGGTDNQGDSDFIFWPPVDYIEAEYGPPPSAFGLAIPQLGDFTCDPLFLEYTTGVYPYVLLNPLATSPLCAGPQYWTSAIITEAPGGGMGLYFLGPDDGGTGVESLLSGLGI